MVVTDVLLTLARTVSAVLLSRGIVALADIRNPLEKPQ